MSVGLMDQKDIQQGRAAGIGNAVMYVGAKTGRDGIHGATFASADFNDENMMQRSAVQVGNPFMEKLLLEACLDLIRNHPDWLVGIQDMAEAVEDAFRYGKLVLATTTYNGDIFPFMKTFIEHLVERNFQNRTVGFIENGSWAPQASRIMRGMLEQQKNLTLLDADVKIYSAVSDKNVAKIQALTNALLQ